MFLTQNICWYLLYEMCDVPRRNGCSKFLQRWMSSWRISRKDRSEIIGHRTSILRCYYAMRRTRYGRRRVSIAKQRVIGQILRRKSNQCCLSQPSNFQLIWTKAENKDWDIWNMLKNECWFSNLLSLGEYEMIRNKFRF